VEIRWTKWARAFHLFAGMDVQDIFYTLEIPEPGEGENVYGVVLATLNNHNALGEGTITTYFKRLRFDAACTSRARTHDLLFAK
jgi:hypothetical protein